MSDLGCTVEAACRCLPPAGRHEPRFLHVTIWCRLLVACIGAIEVHLQRVHRSVGTLPSRIQVDPPLSTSQLSRWSDSVSLPNALTCTPFGKTVGAICASAKMEVHSIQLASTGYCSVGYRTMFDAVLKTPTTAAPSKGPILLGAWHVVTFCIHMCQP